MSQADDVGPLVDHLFRTEYGKIVAVLTSVFRLENLDLAEDVVQDALLTAYRHWSYAGVPKRPAAWLMTVARNKALNVLKHSRRADVVHRKMATHDVEMPKLEVFLETDIEDSMLRMIFACCHPSISEENQIALILKALCGFGSREVARALLIREDTANKRIARAKEDIRRRDIVLELPDGADLDARLDVVCTSIYLLYNEGYDSSRTNDGIDRDVCFEAMRLCRLLVERFKDKPPIHALMALMCFHTARFDSRVDDRGGVVLLAEQDRNTWNRPLINSGLFHLSESAQGELLSVYHLEASIAAQHCLAPNFESTNWAFIRTLYERLYALKPNPIVRLNLAVVSGYLEGPKAAISRLEALRADKHLARYPLLYAALAEFFRRLSDDPAARDALETAVGLASGRQREVLARRLNALNAMPRPGA